MAADDSPLWFEKGRLNFHVGCSGALSSLQVGCVGTGGKEQALLRQLQRQIMSDLLRPKFGRSVLTMPQTCKMQAFEPCVACMQPGTGLHKQSN